MSKQVYVRPKDGLIVRIPGRLHEVLPADGMTVTISAADPYWQRRIDDGDVIVGKPKAAAQKKES